MRPSKRVGETVNEGTSYCSLCKKTLLPVVYFTIFTWFSLPSPWLGHVNSLTENAHTSVFQMDESLGQHPNPKKEKTVIVLTSWTTAT